MKILTATVLALLIPLSASAQMRRGQVCERDFNGAELMPRNAYYQPVFNGLICAAPPSCGTWDCPKRVPESSWKGGLDKKTLAAEEHAKEFEQRLQADYEGRIRSDEALPAATAALLRAGKTVASGPFDASLLQKARPGDRIKVGEGHARLAAGTVMPASVIIEGLGDRTIVDLNRSPLPQGGIRLQDLVLRAPGLPEPSYPIGTVLLARVKVDLPPGEPMSRNWGPVLVMGGSFGRVSPLQFHLLPPNAFGTHAGTLDEEGDFVDMESLPAWVPWGPLREAFRPVPPKWKTTSVKKALARAPWLEPRTPDASRIPAALAEVFPFDRDAEQKTTIAAVKQWFAAEQGLTLKGPHPGIAEMKKDLDAARPLSALYRAARIPAEDFAASEDAARHLLKARQLIVSEYDCHAWFTADKSQRDNATITSEWKQAEAFSIPLKNSAAALLPVARFGKAYGSRCRFVAKIGRDVFQEERVAKNARVEKTEWIISARGLAKQKAKLDAALSNLGKSFDAAASSMEKTWKTFDAYRTRIETSQSGEQVLVSYTGDRNKGNATAFDELERLRRQTNSQPGPGEPGDHYPMTTYVVDVTRRYRHVFEASHDLLYDGKLERNDALVRYDESWTLPPCQDRFLDNSAAVYPAGSTCFVKESPALTAALARAVSDFESHLKTIHIPRLDAASAAKRKGSPEDAAEAALYAVLMGRVATPQDTAALAKVFGADAQPAAVKAAADALLKTHP